MRRALFTCSMIVASVLIGVHTVAAQPASQLSEEALLGHIERARAQGISITDEDVAQMLAMVRGQQVFVVEMQEELEQSVRDKPADLSKPLSHIAGKEGIPFPKPEEVVFEPIPTSTPSPEGTPTPVPTWTPKPYVRPGKCEKGETVRVEIHPDTQEKQVLYDMLYVPEDYVPLDPQEVFGVKTSLIPYGPKEEPGTLLRMRIDNVPCLPYRIRITDRAQYYDSGTNALMNYDGAPAGKGKLNPFIQQKLYPQKNSKNNR